MYWADKVAKELKERNLPLEWVDDMKTPSGRIHVGSLRGVVVHDLVYKALKDAEVKTKYTYLFESSDPMDDLPSYLPKEIYEKYLGLPLYKVPSPQEGYNNYAEFFALEFKKVFNAIGCDPEIIWTGDLYASGKMNDDIKLCLDNVTIIRDIYEETYKKKLGSNWYPFQVYCEQCSKVVTTRVNQWDGEKVSYTCKVDAVDWTKGCGYEGKVSPFSRKGYIAGKLSWKVEWAVKWKVLGVTVEGAGKDHMSAGGSHHIASLVCNRVINYPVPYPVPYEFFLVGGKKMSSSKGLGSSAVEMLTILPPELLRFLMVKTKINQAINFDPSGDTIPKLFDEYQKAADAYFNKTDVELARIYELSQVTKIKHPPTIRFSVLAQWIQMPNMEATIKKEGLEEWVPYAQLWINKYAPEEEKFLVSQDLPESAKGISDKQIIFLQKIAQEINSINSAEELHLKLYEWSKSAEISSKDAFSAIYLSLIGKNHGPRAAWLIFSLDKKFIIQRFTEVSSKNIGRYAKTKVTHLNKPEIFSIDTQLMRTYPSMSVGVAIIEGVSIQKKNDSLDTEKQLLLETLAGITTEQLGHYPEIIAYRKLYKEMGVDWHSRRPSPEALLRRIALHKGLYTVNTCVDAYNLLVLKHRVSIGAFDLNKIEFPTTLRFAKEHEEILLLGDSEYTKYKPTELAYFDKHGGFNLDFNYRDAQRTAVQLETKNLYINVDGIFDISPEKVQEVLSETCESILKYCGGKVKIFGVETSNG